MKLFTQRILIRAVAERWRQAASVTPDLYGHPPRSRAKVLSKLESLDLETATHEEISDIIGNESWTRMDACDECGVVPEVMVRLGEDPDYESSTACICPSCLEKAVRLAKENL